MKSANIFELIPAELDTEVFETLAESENVKIERIVSKGQSSPETGWYDQQCNEWIMVLAGDAIITFEGGEEVRLVAGSYINISAHKKHKVSHTNPDTQTIWLAIHYK